MKTSISLDFDFDGDAHFQGFAERQKNADHYPSIPTLQALIEAPSVSKAKMDEEQTERSDLADNEVASTLPSTDRSRST